MSATAMSATPLSAGRLETRDASRRAHELGLLSRGFVPLTAQDAPYTHFDTLLPGCRVTEVVTDRTHGRIVWSHPGRSGLDPRAVGPLSLVRVADGAGRHPLDPAMKLDEAARWLLDGAVEEWLIRPRHRIVVRYDDVTCVYEVDGRVGRCCTHPVQDWLLQQVAEALGDRSFAACRPRRWTEPHCRVWGRAPDSSHDRTGFARCALAGTQRLGRRYVEGHRGAEAWKLARAGRRTLAAVPDRLELPEVPPAWDERRGMPGFVRWKIACHRPDTVLARCALCGARDDREVCRTCQGEGRTTLLPREWREYESFTEVHPSYRTGEALPAVTCGDANCRTSLALPAAGAEGMQQ